MPFWQATEYAGYNLVLHSLLWQMFTLLCIRLSGTAERSQANVALTIDRMPTPGGAAGFPFFAEKVDTYLCGRATG